MSHSRYSRHIHQLPTTYLTPAIRDVSIRYLLRPSVVSPDLAYAFKSNRHTTDIDRPGVFPQLLSMCFGGTLQLTTMPICAITPRPSSSMDNLKALLLSLSFTHGDIQEQSHCWLSAILPVCWTPSYSRLWKNIEALFCDDSERDRGSDLVRQRCAGPQHVSVRSGLRSECSGVSTATMPKPPPPGVQIRIRSPAAA
jgi:hypothetical protein